MEENGFYFQALVYLAAAVIAVPIAKKLGLSSVLGYLIAGVLIGPFVLGLVGHEGENIMYFAEFGVVMMLFLVGLEVQPNRLWQLRVHIGGMGGAQLFLTAAIFMIIGIKIARLPWQTSLAIGLILALSSTAITLQTLNEGGKLNTLGGQSSFSVLLFQDLSVIPILEILPFLAIGGIMPTALESNSDSGTSWTNGLPIIVQGLIILGAVLLIVFMGRYIITPAFRLIAKTRIRELFTAAALLLVISIAILMSRVGLSPALGTFLAGVLLAQSEYRHELETDIEPFKGLLLGLFFITVGASIDFKIIKDFPFLIAGLVASLILIKMVVLFAIGKIFKIGLDNNLLFALGLSQAGEFAFVLFSFSTQHQIISPSIANPLVVVVAISMAVTPLLMLINERIILPFIGTQEKEKRIPDNIEEQKQVIIAGFGRVGRIIGRFLQANNVKATYLDIDPDNVDMLRNLGLKVFYGDASRYELLHSAGADKASLLVIAVDNPEKTRKIVETAKKHFPHLDILARTHGFTDSYELLDIGIQHVYRETLDSALRMAEDTLCKLGFRKFQTHRAIKTFRKRDEHYLRELSEIRHDKEALINGTKERIQGLENLLIRELENIAKDQNLGWDASSRIEEFGPLQREEKRQKNE